jgi:hypothetical protein
MRVLHRTAAVVLGIAALVIVGLLVDAAVSGKDVNVRNFVLLAIAAVVAVLLGRFLWGESES